ncbi:MAG: asparagine synthase (glutamine-hydrolyzing) [Desulfobacterales bacterium]|jgi:asparagine synthase (glutamine-hydrolysing)|nr:asparagine synthase (glutamine-hydrolyzing) [Desulfobacterales bacterium]
MCGIVAIINKNRQPADLGVLARMADAIRHRGPDEEGHLVDGPVGLYHKRLSIIDLSTGRQPMTSGAVSIVFNGEIYNYIELRAELKAKGYEFKTTSDTEVILQLYREHGEECVKRLNGMFAFVLYDADRRRILAARDHFGIKPLYYFMGENSILFASEIKALLEHPEVRPEPDYDALYDYLTFQYVLGTATLFKNVQKLLPGHLQVIDLEAMSTRTRRYWEPEFSVDLHHTEAYFIYTLQNLLVDTVNIQLRSDVPVGAYLSGGMDSSLVTILAAEKYPGRLKTFTGAFHEGPQFNELKYAKEVAERCNAEMFVVYPTEADFIDLLPRLIYHMDEPAAGPGLFPQYMVSRLAAQEVKVVLGGQGGDEIFGGYARFLVAYFEQAIKGAIFETHDEGEHIVSLTSILPNLPHLKPYVPMLKRFFEKDAFESADRRYFRLIDRSEGDMGLLTPDYRNGYSSEAAFSKFQQRFNHPETLSYYNKMVHYDLTASLPALMQVEDRVTMANSLESRVPLLDHRIVELITSMPPRMKFKGGEMKYILKKAVKNILPPAIFHRKDKMGFPVPLHLWAKNNAGRFFRDVLLSQACRERGLFDTRAIEKLIDNESAFGRRLWGLMCLELWFRTFMDKR